MGQSIDKERFADGDYERFAARLQDDLAALEALLARPGFGEGPTTLGAELEVSIIDEHGCALPVNREALAGTVDSRLQLEIDRFNLEFNVDPVPAAGAPFSALEQQLDHGIELMDRAVAPLGGRIACIGILPTLRLEDLQAGAMTDMPRFRALDAGIRRLRQRPFEIHIDGQEPLILTCDAVTLQGANTSFQIHVRVNPSEYAAMYNAVQLVTPLAVAAGANSPIHVGHRLWDETRVALFKQSTDPRVLGAGDWGRSARVLFGHGWVRRSALELFEESVALHPPLLPVAGDEEPLEVVARGGVPRLQGLRLHQGTIWQWNRAVYDSHDGGHLRIEIRALAGGPTPVDMAANAAFLVGMAVGLRPHIDRLLSRLPFKYAEHNFYRAAQSGLDATLLWPATSGTSPRARPVRELCLEHIEVAASGLRSLGVEAGEVTRMLDVIGERVSKGMSPARWQRRVLDHLDARMARPQALHRLLEIYLAEARTGRPVSQWSHDSP